MRNKIVPFVAEVINIYFGKRVERAASALSYSMIFTLFPFLICLNAMLGSFNLTEHKLIELFSEILPIGALELITTYFAYITETSAKTQLFYLGLVATLTSSSAAFRLILNTMDEIHGAPQRLGFFRIIFSFVISIAFLIITYASCAIIICGKWLMKMVEDYFNIILFVDTWKWLRFVILFMLMFGVILAIYKISAPKNQRQNIPRVRGAFIAAVMLSAISIVFSRAITFSTRYTLIYGSLASIIILLFWLYTSGCIIFLGNIINIVIYKYTDASKNYKIEHEKEKKEALQ